VAGSAAAVLRVKHGGLGTARRGVEASVAARVAAQRPRPVGDRAGQP